MGTRENGVGYSQVGIQCRDRQVPSNRQENRSEAGEEGTLHVDVLQKLRNKSSLSSL